MPRRRAATATAMCASTARRPGSRTAASPTSTSSSPAPARRRARRGSRAFVVDADAPGLAIAERIDVIAPHPLATLALRGLPRAADAAASASRARASRSRMAHARRLPHDGRRRGARLRPARARRGARPARQRRSCSAQPLGGSPAHAGDARRHGDRRRRRRRCSSTAPPGRKDHGARARHARGGDGEDVRHRGGAAA